MISTSYCLFQHHLLPIPAPTIQTFLPLRQQTYSRIIHQNFIFLETKSQLSSSSKARNGRLRDFWIENSENQARLISRDRSTPISPRVETGSVAPITVRNTVFDICLTSLTNLSTRLTSLLHSQVTSRRLRILRREKQSSWAQWSTSRSAKAMTSSRLTSSQTGQLVVSWVRKSCPQSWKQFILGMMGSLEGISLRNSSSFWWRRQQMTQTISFPTVNPKVFRAYSSSPTRPSSRSSIPPISRTISWLSSSLWTTRLSSSLSSLNWVVWEGQREGSLKPWSLSQGPWRQSSSRRSAASLTFSRLSWCMVHSKLVSVEWWMEASKSKREGEGEVWVRQNLVVCWLMILGSCSQSSCRCSDSPYAMDMLIIFITNIIKTQDLPALQPFTTSSQGIQHYVDRPGHSRLQGGKYLWTSFEYLSSNPPLNLNLGGYHPKAAQMTASLYAGGLECFLGSDLFEFFWNSLELCYNPSLQSQLPSPARSSSPTSPCPGPRLSPKLHLPARLWSMALLNFNCTGYMHRLALLSATIEGKSAARTKILVEVSEGTATIWLNSPKDLNCLSTTMAREIKEALAELDSDQAVKIIVFRSKHSKIFCAGADIKHMNENDYASFPNSLHFLSIERAFKNVRKPILSVVQGKALGGGFELALLTDIIVASPSASFGLPEITLGLIPGMGGTQLLTRTVGTKKAMKMILTGEPISSEEAHRLNIAHLIPEANFEGDVKKLLEVLLNKASGSLQAAKRSIRFAWETTLEQGLQHETSIFQGLFSKEGPMEGLSAFAEKRKPNFRNM